MRLSSPPGGTITEPRRDRPDPKNCAAPVSSRVNCLCWSMYLIRRNLSRKRSILPPRRDTSWMIIMENATARITDTKAEMLASIAIFCFPWPFFPDDRIGGDSRSQSPAFRRLTADLTFVPQLIFH